MILPDNFRTKRFAAISKLDENQKKDSFGYHIDVNNWWETIYDSSELNSYLSIHNTHASKFNELSHDIEEYLDFLKPQFLKHSSILEKTSRYFTTQKLVVDYKYDLLELGVDWLALNFISKEINSIVDYGAGCGRQIIGALSHCSNLSYYFPVDTSTNAYVVQNGMFSTLEILDHIKHFDLLEIKNDEKLNIINSSYSQPTVFHFPAWENHDLIKDKSIDIVMACHVHNEIGPNDFERLMSIVVNKMSENGIFYVRSELGIWGDTHYEDSTSYHAIDPVVRLSKEDIIPLSSKYFGGFQTTIFCRRSQFNNLKSMLLKDSNKFWKNNDLIDKTYIDHKEVAFHCARNYVQFLIDKVQKAPEDVIVIDEGFDYGSSLLTKLQTIFDNIKGESTLAKFVKGLSKNKNIIKISSIDELHEIDLSNKSIIVNSVEFYKYEEFLTNESRTRFQYLFPFVLSLPYKKNFSTTFLLNEENE